jgi:hypothetical protein
VQGDFTLQADCSTKINDGLLNAAKRTLANLNNISEKLIEKVEARRTELCANVRLLEAASTTATTATAATAATATGAAAAGDASTSSSITVTYAIAYPADADGTAAAQRAAETLSSISPAVLLASLQQAAVRLKGENPALDLDVSGVTGATASQPVVVSVAAVTASPTAAPATKPPAATGGIKTGVIIGAVIGGVAAVLLLGGGSWWALHRRAKQLQTVIPDVTAGAVASPTGARAAAVPANAASARVTAATAVPATVVPVAVAKPEGL